MVQRSNIDQIVDELEHNFCGALYDIGFLQGTIGNPDVRKLEHSFSGHALDISIRAVVAKVILYITRCWESNGASIPRFIDLVQGLAKEIEADRIKKWPDMNERFLEIGLLEGKILALKDDAAQFRSRKDYQSIRVHRDEELAHHLKGKSGIRRRLSKAGLEIDPATYDAVIELALITADFHFRALQIWRFTGIDYTSWIEDSKGNTEIFWKLLPKLSEAEAES